jgi:mRNA interferase RelE/StbE
LVPFNSAENRRAVVVFTEPALEDLRRFRASAPSVVPLFLKKLLLLERNPFAGEALLGGLIGYRKITVGNRHWRIVCKVIEENSGDTIIEVAEVWALGARADSEVYREVRKRIEKLGATPETLAIASTVARLSRGVDANEHSEPVEDPVPTWLSVRLTEQVGLTAMQISQLSGEAAMKLWEAFITRPRD